MLILRSREERAGSKTGREHDFHHTREGEVLTIPSIVCEGDEEYRVKCGCGRSFTGIESQAATTVGVVEELEEPAAKAVLRESDLVSAWAKDWNEEEAFDAFWSDFKGLSDALQEAHDLDGLPVGAVVRIKSQPDQYQLISVRPKATKGE